MLTIPGIEPRAGEAGAGSPEVRAVTPEGDVIALVPADSPAAQAAAYAQDDDITTVMEITDVAPVSVPHRIRGRAWVAGWLTAVRNEQRAACAKLLGEAAPSGMPPGTAWLMLRLEVGEAFVDDLWSAEHVEPDDFVAARPDPLVRHEAELLQHLGAAHADQVRGLCACRTDEHVAPLALDQYGLRVRFWDDDAQRCADARFEFPERVRTVAELRRAMHALFRSPEG
ncbi:DUF2470 domain-containing protein [Streptomyces boncukensis]|nr:DUF2470 domain-containing protein [Streptomyces boncukensis]